jgi:hypothetical protein
MIVDVELGRVGIRLTNTKNLKQAMWLKFESHSY